MFEVILIVFTVEQSMFSFQLMVTGLFSVTFVAPPAGDVELTEGGVVSMVTVLPADGVSTLADESVARLCIV